jgi:hypothetical protein
MFAVLIINCLVHSILKVVDELGILAIHDTLFDDLPIAFLIEGLVLEKHMFLHIEEAVIRSVEETHTLLNRIVWHDRILVQFCEKLG